MKLELAIELAAGANSFETAPAYPRVRHLETLLARGDRLTATSNTLDQWLATTFGYEPTHALPSAALSALGDGLDPGHDYWLRIDPVCLSATRTHLVLTELAADDLTMAEAQALGSAVAAHLAAYAAKLAIVHPQRWYLRLAAAAEMQCTPPSACSGVLAETHLPSGPDSAQWKRIITEVQMLLHEHPVNEAREASGKIPANAVWPWGGGHLPHARSRVRYETVFSADPLARGLARAAGATAQTLPDGAEDLMVHQAPGTTALAILRTAFNTNTITALEQTQVQPLYRALERASLEALTLRLFLPQSAVACYVTRARLHRWWRRVRPLSAYA